MIALVLAEGYLRNVFWDSRDVLVSVLLRFVDSFIAANQNSNYHLHQKSHDNKLKEHPEVVKLICIHEFMVFFFEFEDFQCHQPHVEA